MMMSDKRIEITPERIDALEKALDAVNEWIYRDRRINAPRHPLEKVIPILEKMIREAKGEPEPIEDFSLDDDEV